MSLTSRLQALLTYANEKTEAGDTTIGAAIKTLAEGYSGGSGSATYPSITDADTLSSRIQALLAYADNTTGVADATLAEAIKRLCDGYNTTPQWMLDAAEEYGVSIANLKAAVAEYPNVERSFTTKDNYLISAKGGCINSGIIANQDTAVIFEGEILDESYGILFAPFGCDTDSTTRAYEIYMRYYVSSTQNGDQLGYGTVSNAGNIKFVKYTPMNTQFRIEARKNVWTNIIDGATYWSNTFTKTSFTTSETMRVLNYKRYNTALTTNRKTGACNLCYINNGSIAKLFVPFKRDGEVGMIDLLADDISADSAFYTNENSGGTLTLSE